MKKRPLKFTKKQIAYLETVSWHDAQQSEDKNLRRIAAGANKVLQSMQPKLRRRVPPMTRQTSL